MAHQGLGTFPEHFQAHCSSIDTVSAVLDEEDRSDHIEYFQGYVQFYERGLPGELPAETKESILEKPDMLKIRDRIELFEQSHDEKSLKSEKLIYRKRWFDIAFLSSGNIKTGGYGREETGKLSIGERKSRRTWKMTFARGLKC